MACILYVVWFFISCICIQYFHLYTIILHVPYFVCFFLNLNSIMCVIIFFELYIFHLWCRGRNISKIEKVPRGIRGEKSSKDMASSRNLVSTIGAFRKSQNGGRNQVSGRVSVPCWHATPVANAPWKPLIIGEGQARYQGHEIGGKSDWLGSHCWSRIRMSFNIRERDTSYCWIRSPYRP